MLAELAINGKPTKVVLQVARNGFVYLLDRKTGQLLPPALRRSDLEPPVSIRRPAGPNGPDDQIQPVPDE